MWKRESTFISDEKLIEMLPRVQTKHPEARLVLLGDDGTGVSVHTPETIAGNLGDASFPLTEAEGAIPLMCQLAMQLQARGECQSWAVAALRGVDHWEVFHAFPKGRHKIASGSKDLHPIGSLLPTLRKQAHITKADLARGVTMKKADARDRLLKSLRELAGLYEASDQPQRADAIWDELGPLLTETLTVRHD
ncbi:hypothetical protein [Cryobacterium tagatosivorans]|uniref:Uncharacterized protein n=1 Tax=Cryobacterium tagatosivorans TaxID=1259199 RepID=A0A4R8UGG3_9MICO|nr:hypothetical protein [Cryobacterium tagatosivorans]TFB51962.1 hypothetical protein E3O23_07190 [Cryobacterium tagatosivorans]